MTSNKATLGLLAELVSGEVQGDVNTEIKCVSDIKSAQQGSIAYIASGKYMTALANTKASAVIVSSDLIKDYSGNAIIVDNTKLAFAKIAQHLHPVPKPKVGVHSTAIVDSSAKIGKNVSIGPYVVIDAEAVIGDNSTICAHSTIGEHCVIGNNSYFFSNVTIYYGCVLGENCILQSGVVIGSEGFGFAPSANGWEKVPQLGRVIIGNRVEIGANTAIDRGALEDTVIGNNVILDNLIQIAHNVRVGDNTAIAACVGIAGSAVIGKNCMIGGGSNINGHISICDNVHLVGNSGVARSITKPGGYGSTTTVTDIKSWRRNMLRFNQLDKIAISVSSLEAKLKEIQER
jgi:UDP-3-O-[3-hydroxymyristoyl] glucosamine N-acyltransferase